MIFLQQVKLAFSRLVQFPMAAMSPGKAINQEPLSALTIQEASDHHLERSFETSPVP